MTLGVPGIGGAISDSTLPARTRRGNSVGPCFQTLRNEKTRSANEGAVVLSRLVDEPTLTGALDANNPAVAVGGRRPVEGRPEKDTLAALYGARSVFCG